MNPPKAPDDEIEMTARLPVLVTGEDPDDQTDTDTWADGESPFADFGGGQGGEVHVAIVEGDATVDQLMARLAESEAWAAQLQQELDRLRAPPPEPAPVFAIDQGLEIVQEPRASALEQRLHEVETAQAGLASALGVAEAARTAADEVALRLVGERDDARAERDAVRAELERSHAALERSHAEVERSHADADRLRAEFERNRTELLEARAAAAKGVEARERVGAPAQRPVPAPVREAPALREEVLAQALRIETLLERLRTAEARRRIASDFRRSGAAEAESGRLAGLRRQLADLEARATVAQAEAARAGDRARIAETARAESLTAAQARERELEAKVATLEQSVLALALEARDLRARESTLPANAAALPPEQAMRSTAATLPPPGYGTFDDLLDEPTVVVDDDGTLARRVAEMESELRQREHRIQVLETELASRSEALLAIRRALGFGPGERATAVPVPAAEVAPRWLVRLDDGSGRVHALGSARCTVGRTPDNDVEVAETFVSRHHATIKIGAESVIIEDAGSTNGVFVNDARVKRQLLRDGDIVAFGKARYRFHTSRPAG